MEADKSICGNGGGEDVVKQEQVPLTSAQLSEQEVHLFYFIS